MRMNEETLTKRTWKQKRMKEGEIRRRDKRDIEMAEVNSRESRTSDVAPSPLKGQRGRRACGVRSSTYMEI